MTLHLNLSPEAEELLRQRAKAAGLTPEEFARRTVEQSLRQPAAQAAAGCDAWASLGPGELPPEEIERRLQAFHEWVAMARPSTAGVPLDDSRESIYEGRGE